MKKSLLLLTLIFAMIMTSIPLSASAAPIKPIKLILNDQAILFPDAQPYASGDEIWIPLRHTAEALGLNIQFTSETQLVRLTRPDVILSFRLGSDAATMADGPTISFGSASFAKQNRIYVPLSFFEKLLALDISYDKQLAEATIRSNLSDSIIASIVNKLNTGSFQQLIDENFDDSIKPLISVESLQAVWGQVGAAAGDYIGIQTIQQNEEVEDIQEYSALIAFSKINVILTVNLNERHKVIGLWVNLAHLIEELPAQVTEEELVVSAGTSYPLPGTLTLPADASAPIPAVVLVQGSGPSDRDETAGAYKPFRDLAWGLAQQGIAVLRYDKRTFVHGGSYTPDMVAGLTIKDETIDDAIAAADLLKNDPRIDASRVYVIGHSLGGMMAPRIDAEGGDFAGLIILAGSPRSLWEISADQNADLIQSMDDSDPTKKIYEAWLEDELLKAGKLSDLSDAEAKSETLFGIPAYYFKEMDEHPTAAFTKQLIKPIFILQGEDDFQVFANKDYILWQQLLANHANATFKLYPGLNHFFVDYEGEGENTIDEYSYPGKVDAQIIQDIADWIIAQ